MKLHFGYNAGRKTFRLDILRRRTIFTVGATVELENPSADEIAALDDDQAQIESDLASAELTMATSAGRMSSARAAACPAPAETFDLLVLDWNSPNMTGVDVIEWVRQNLQAPPPMLLLTSRSGEKTWWRAWMRARTTMSSTAGKPAGAGGPRQRAAAQDLSHRGRRPGNRSASVDHDFNIQARTVTVDGQDVQLTAKEFTLTLLLFRNTHRALSRSHIPGGGHLGLIPTWRRGPSTCISRIRAC